MNDVTEVSNGRRRGSQKHALGIITDSVNRPAHDFYRTPRRGIEALLDAEEKRLPGPIWEPACGDGAISSVLEERGYEVYSTDLVYRGYGLDGVDFLDKDYPAPRVRTILTNPPYTHAQAFAERALSVPKVQVVAMLCRLLWLESVTRQKFFRESGLSRVWVFSKRINIARNADPRYTDGEGGTVAFAWYVWDRRAVNVKPEIGWL